MELCFAYGSNTDRVDWAAWCRRTGHDPACIEPVGTALLPDQALAFNYYSTTRGGGALNLHGRVGGVVAGVLLRAGATGWAALDIKEGVAARHYQRVQRVAILPNGSGVPVTTYEVTRERRGGFHPPTLAYLDAVRRGYGDHGIGSTPLEAAASGRDGRAGLAEVFAYGTLRQGECRFPAMMEAGVTAVTPTRTAGRLHDFGAHPAMVLAAGVVTGEVMTLADPAASLPVLDAIEEAPPQGGFGGLYRRTIIQTASGQAWAYVMDARQVAGRPVIASGDWCCRAGGSDGVDAVQGRATKA